jgi:erythromycin esterase-like protein
VVSNILISNSYGDAIQWIERNHISEDHTTSELSPKIKESLNTNLKEKRFVFLGEPDHYFEEKYSYRLKFIEHLLTMDYFHILDEMGFQDGRMVNSYLETGDENYLNKIGLYGFKYSSPLFASKSTFVKSAKRYMRKLRELKLRYPKLRYGGFDLDIGPGNAYLLFDHYYLQLSQYSDFNTFYLHLEASKGSPNLDDKIFNLESAQSELVRVDQKLAKVLNLEDYTLFKNSMRNFLSSFIFQKGFENYSSELFAWREYRMFENMEYIFKSSNIKNEKIIMLGHNGHLTKVTKDVREVGGEEHWYTIGTWLSEKFPNEVYAIWSLIGKGRHRGHGCPPRKSCDFSSPVNTLEYDLLNINSDKSLYFTVSKKNFSGNDGIYNTYVNGIQVTEGPLAKQVDAIYFIPVVRDLQKN